jgi:hypothetical protein
MRLTGIGLVITLVTAPGALAQTSFLSLHALEQRVYFVDTDSEKGAPPNLSVRTLVAIDPPLDRGISARDMTVSVDCTANTFTITGLVSLDRELKQVSTDPEPTKPAAATGPFKAIRDYLCEGKIPSGASRYDTRGLALDAGLRIIAANRANPERQ